MKKTVKLLLYCTKAKPNLMDFDMDRKHFNINYGGQVLNGKIVAEAECDLVEEIKFINDSQYGTNTLNQNDLLKESCIGMFDLYEYLFNKDTGYGIYLKNVKPFDEPKELSYYGIKRAPQNMCYADEIIVYPTYIENNFTGYEEYYENHVLISIRPEWLCKILNGEKTIEIRTSILNVLKELIK